MTKTSITTLNMKRKFGVPAEKVFDAWTNAEMPKKWCSPWNIRKWQRVILVSAEHGKLWIIEIVKITEQENLIERTFRVTFSKSFFE
jgi:uncharacterized protein YndB with AHSA1/START domain